MKDVKESINSEYMSDDSLSSGFWTNSSEQKKCSKKIQKYGALVEYEKVKPKVYTVRYVMLFLFSLCTLMNGFQWIQYPIVASIVTCYYNVSVETNNMTSILFMIMFMPFILPVAWTMNNKGLKMTLILAAAGNSLGSCLQCFSLSPERYYMVIFAQTVSSIAQVFSVCAPAYVAALWFPSSSVSTACAVGVLSNQIGIALGLIVPPLLVPNDCGDKVSVETGFRNLALGQAIINSVIFILVVLFFRDKPPTPPSIAEANKPLQPQSTWNSMKTMLRNKDFFLLAVASGLMASVYFAILTMLNQIVVRAFPGMEVDAGWMGVENVFAGVLGSIVTGYIMDKTHAFRATCVAFYCLSLVSIVAYTAVFMIKKLWLYFIMLGLQGFTLAGSMPVAFQLAAEITYPESEGTSATLLIGSTSLLGIFVTLFASWLQQNYGDLYSNLFFSVCAVMGAIMCVFVKCDNKRTSEESAEVKHLEIRA